MARLVTNLLYCLATFAAAQRNSAHRRHPQTSDSSSKCLMRPLPTTTTSPISERLKFRGRLGRTLPHDKRHEALWRQEESTRDACCDMCVRWPTCKWVHWRRTNSSPRGICELHESMGVANHHQMSSSLDDELLGDNLIGLVRDETMTENEERQSLAEAVARWLDDGENMRYDNHNWRSDECRASGETLVEGDDVGLFGGVTRAHCCAECRANARCRAYVWLADGNERLVGTCWMKNATGPLRRANVGFYTGVVRETFDSAPTHHYSASPTLHHDYDTQYQQSDDGRLFSNSASLQSALYQTQHNDQAQITHSLDSTAYSDVSEGQFSATFRYLTARGYDITPGHSLEHLQPIRVERCAVVCLAMPDCVALTYRRRTSECRLKSSERPVLLSSESDVSSVFLSPPLPIAEQQRSLYGTPTTPDYSSIESLLPQTLEIQPDRPPNVGGYQLIEQSVIVADNLALPIRDTNVKRCIAACSLSQRCQAFVFTPSSGTCELKAAVGPLHQSERAHTFFAPTVEYTFKELAGNRAVVVQPPGQPFGRDTPLESCLSACATWQRCIGFTRRELSGGSCSLVGSHLELRREHGASFLLLLKFAGAPRRRQQHATAYSKIHNFWRHDGAVPLIDDKTDIRPSFTAQSQSQDYAPRLPARQSFLPAVEQDYVPARQTTFLPPADNDDKQLWSMAADSGRPLADLLNLGRETTTTTTTTTPTPRPMKCLFVEDAVVNATVLEHEALVASAQLCCERCGETERCRAFTWMRSERDCWLHEDARPLVRMNGATIGVAHETLDYEQHVERSTVAPQFEAVPQTVSAEDVNLALQRAIQDAVAQALIAGGFDSVVRMPVNNASVQEEEEFPSHFPAVRQQHMPSHRIRTIRIGRGIRPLVMHSTALVGGVSGIVNVSDTTLNDCLVVCATKSHCAAVTWQASDADALGLCILYGVIESSSFDDDPNMVRHVQVAPSPSCTTIVLPTAVRLPSLSAHLRLLPGYQVDLASVIDQLVDTQLLECIERCWHMVNCKALNFQVPFGGVEQSRDSIEDRLELAGSTPHYLVDAPGHCTLKSVSGPLRTQSSEAATGGLATAVLLDETLYTTMARYNTRVTPNADDPNGGSCSQVEGRAVQVGVLRMRRTETLGECCSECLAERNCRAYTWVRGSTHCWLSSSSGPVVNRPGAAYGVAFRVQGNAVKTRLAATTTTTTTTTTTPTTTTADEAPDVLSVGGSMTTADASSRIASNLHEMKPTQSRQFVKMPLQSPSQVDVLSVGIGRVPTESARISTSQASVVLRLKHNTSALQSHNHCQLECLRTAACLSVSTNGGQCQQDASKGAGNTIMPPIEHGFRVVHRKLLAPGHLLAVFHRHSVAECVHECARMPLCVAFNWAKRNGGSCWLKSERASLVDADKGVAVGVRVSTDDEHEACARRCRSSDVGCTAFHVLGGECRLVSAGKRRRSLLPVLVDRVLRRVPGDT